MTFNRIIFVVGGLAILLGLAGCKRDPRDIAKWKADGNTGKLIAATADHRQFVRIDAIDALAELKAAEAIDPLVALFSDPDLVVVHKAIDAVASMEDPRVEKHMLNALGIKTAPARITAATKLGTLKSEAAVDPLIALLDEKDEAVVVAAATALGQIGNPKAINPLAEKVDERSYNIRMASVTSLGQIGGTDAAKGLEPAMGDLSENVRNSAIKGLVRIGPSSAPLALNALRSGNHYARESGVAILQGLNDVPTAGSDMVWYRLSVLTAGEKPVVDPAKDTGLAHMDNMEALLEALVHEQREVRDYALLTLTAIGEPAVAPVLSVAEQNADMEARAWLNGRSNWHGAPAWQLDLWAAVATLDPGFKINKRIVTALVPHSHSAEQMMKSDEFTLRQVYVPLLIAQFATAGTKFTTSQHSLFGIDFTIENVNFEASETQYQIDRRRTKRCRQIAAEHLIKADYLAVLPLLAALYDNDLEIAAHSARTLIRISNEKAEEPVITAFSTHLEKGAELSDTTFQIVMQELGTPEADTLLLKVRPNVAQAIKTAREKYPGVEFKNIPLENKIDPSLKAAPFKLAYSDGRHDKVLKVVFRPNGNGDWIPMPALPDTLPE